VNFLPAIPLLPGFGALLLGVAGIRLFDKRTTALVACATMGMAFVLSALAFVQLLALPRTRASTPWWSPPGFRRSCCRPPAASAPSASTGRSGSTRWRRS
jgi:NADH:ubiquinone oxidoreductase subunit 5 (subunit L)/multisubunit Na+/H+ antiporter MnhA subunit